MCGKAAIALQACLAGGRFLWYNCFMVQKEQLLILCARIGYNP
jgi:hypothetical protein